MILLGRTLFSPNVWADGLPPPPIVTSSPVVTGKPDESAQCFPGVFMTRFFFHDHDLFDQVLTVLGGRECCKWVRVEGWVVGAEMVAAWGKLCW